MKTQDVIDMALASGMYQDGEMFFSPATGDADVHIADLEYFSKTVEERTLSRQKASYYQEGYEAGQHDMFTKQQNVDTSAERVHESDISIHDLPRENRMNIKELAEQAGFTFDTLGATYTSGSLPQILEHFAELVAAAERESCAKLCDEQWGFEIAKFCAKLIRARGDKHD